MYQYTYDANGNIATSVERSYDKGTGGVPINSSYSKSSYTYDNLNQLTQITDDSQKEKTKISYDNAGNIKKVQVYNSSTNALKKTNTYGYDTTWKDKLTSYNGETITYDGIGNPLKYRNGMTMQWKNGRQLSQVKTSKDTITYKYNIKGLRTRKYNSDYTYYYYYDDNNNLIAMMQGGVVAYFYYDSNNSVTAMSINDSMYYYIKNLQGDITKIVNHQGKVMVEYTYDAWGNILKEKSNVTPSYATVKEFNPFRYRGYVYDTDTGLYYLQSRYYDPKTGRFINADDTAYVDTNSGTPLSTNMFAYCENNHIIFIDPTGYSKTYVIYYNDHRRGFKKQAMNSPYYNSKSKSVRMVAVTSSTDFIRAWNRMCGAIDNVYLYVHGGSGILYFKNNSISFKGTHKFKKLKSKKVKGRIFLFSCNGGNGKEGNNVAWMFAKLTGTSVYACTGSVSYTKIFGKYYARKAKDWGIIKTFYYQKRYVFWGPIVAKSLPGHW